MLSTVPRLSVLRGTHRPVPSHAQSPGFPPAFIGGQRPERAEASVGEGSAGISWHLSATPCVCTPGWVTTAPGLGYNFALKWMLGAERGQGVGVGTSKPAGTRDGSWIPESAGMPASRAAAGWPPCAWSMGLLPSRLGRGRGSCLFLAPASSMECSSPGCISLIAAGVPTVAAPDGPPRLH